MASRTLQKLLRNHHSPKIVAHLCNTGSRSPPWQIAQVIAKPPVDQAQSPKPNNPFGCSHCYYYPSFSFEHFLNPVAPSVRPEPVEELNPDDARTMRADSVKKKRKKKMNKHKLRKLRKRLRRKT